MKNPPARCLRQSESITEELTDELESQVFVGSRLFGVFVQKHDGTSDPAVLQSLLTHAGQLQRGKMWVRVWGLDLW